MCCNVGGYGALSVWTFVWAVLMVLMNGMTGLLPCTQAMEAWGIHQECTAMEADFFVQQSVLFVTLFITYAVVAAMKPEKVLRAHAQSSKRVQYAAHPFDYSSNR